jgi:hypothetical protein
MMNVLIDIQVFILFSLINSKYGERAMYKRMKSNLLRDSLVIVFLVEVLIHVLVYRLHIDAVLGAFNIFLELLFI